MKYYLVIISVLIASLSFAQEKTYSEEDITVSKWIDGTLLSPKETSKPILVIIIAGSGPTNRDGNQNFLQNKNLQKA